MTKQLPDGKTNDENGVTVWTVKDDVIRSVYGNVRYEDWCLLEIARLKKDGREVQMEKEGRWCRVRWIEDRVARKEAARRGEDRIMAGQNHGE